MKYFVIFLVTIGLSISFITTYDAFGLCFASPDWPDEPCWGKRCANSDEPACIDPNWWKERWAPYYDYKGSEWMEEKKQEMMYAIQNDNLFEWIQLTQDNGTHSNVHKYYFYFGEVPDLDGNFVDDVFAENRLALSSDATDTDYTTLVFFAVLGIVPAALIGIAIFWMKRK